MRNFLFLIDRQLYYKYLSPIVDEVFRRGQTVICLHDYRDGATRYAGIKAEQFPALSSCPQFRHGTPKLKVRRNNREIETVIAHEDIDVVVALHGPNHYDIPPEIRQRVVWIQVQHGHDCFREKAGVAEADIFACYAPIWPTHFMAVPTENTYYVGCPVLDAVEYRADAIKTKYSLPPHTEVITYFANDEPRLTWVPEFLNRMWYRFVFSDDSWSGRYDGAYRFLSRFCVTELGLVEALRAYADARNAALVIKSRAKRKLSPRLVRLADIVLYDESYYPATNYELMQISSLIVCMASTAQIEAAYFGTPAISLYPSRLSKLFCKDLAKCFPIDLAVKTQTMESFISDMQQGRLRPPAIAEFRVDELFGPEDGCSASRIFDLAANISQKKQKQFLSETKNGV